VNLALLRPVLFWIFIVVAGTGEAAFAYNEFTGGWLRWVLSGLIIVNICLLALLDRTPAVRKAITYIAAAVWCIMLWATATCLSPMSCSGSTRYSMPCCW